MTGLLSSLSKYSTSWQLDNPPGVKVPSPTRIHVDCIFRLHPHTCPIHTLTHIHSCWCTDLRWQTKALQLQEQLALPALETDRGRETDGGEKDGRLWPGSRGLCSVASKWWELMTKAERNTDTNRARANPHFLFKGVCRASTATGSVIPQSERAKLVHLGYTALTTLDHYRHGGKLFMCATKQNKKR